VGNTLTVCEKVDCGEMVAIRSHLLTQRKKSTVEARHVHAGWPEVLSPTSIKVPQYFRTSNSHVILGFFVDGEASKTC
jgi:hypothetical protein